MTVPRFPYFTKIELEDKADYNRLISRWPAFSDISFTSLHIWWNLDGQLSLASLNNNLVINYVQPFDKVGSGFSLLGDDMVDDSIDEILGWLGQEHRKSHLVHVPEFTIDKITDKEKYQITEEVDNHEYVMSSTQLAALEGGPHAYTRKKVRRFLREIEGKKLEVRPVDLATVKTKELLLTTLAAWQHRFSNKNDPDRNEDLALRKTLAHSEHLETQNLCLFIDNRLHGIVLYHLSHDKKHYILNHLKVDYSVPYMFDFMTNQVAIQAVNNGVEFLNMEMDLGLPGLRQHKQGLRPVHYYKKFTLSLA